MGCCRKGRAQRREALSVRCAKGDDPLLALARNLGDQLEICVVVEHGEIVSLRHRGHEGINQRERSVLAPDGQGCLDLEAPSMVGLVRWQGIER